MEWLKYAIDFGIIGLLLLMSVVAVAIGIEKYLLFKKIKISDFDDKRSLEIVLTAKMHVIASIGSNAPYIGLLGTVLGIMLTFYSMGQNGLMDSSKIMIGLALALKVTAVGLLVAIPAVTIYNTLLRKCKVLLMEWEINDGRERV
jgi:biopolymer transport protein ExbB